MTSNSRIRLANEIDIRDIIKSWASCYDLPPVDLAEVIDRTVNAAIDDEHIGLNDDPEISLFALLDRFAAEKMLGRYDAFKSVMNDNSKMGNSASHT
ncbi:MAG: hypothetical protein ACK4ZU_01955 [Allorhizobium sp.]